MATSAVIPNMMQGSGANGNVPMAPGAKASTGPVIPTSTTAATNPFAAAGTTPAVPGAVPSTVQSNGINWADGSNTVTGDFSDTYGKGTGTAITNVLQNLGTTTDSAIQATIANTDLAAANQYGNIQATQAASGITPNSSTAALAAGDFYSQVNSALQQTIGGEELSEENTLLGALTNEGAAHGSDTSTWDSITSALGSILPGVSSAANAINTLPGIGTGTTSSILDAIGALG